MAIFFNLFELIIIPTTHAWNRSLIFFKKPGRLLDFSVVRVGRGSENFQILFLKWRGRSRGPERGSGLSEPTWHLWGAGLGFPAGRHLCATQYSHQQGCQPKPLDAPFFTAVFFSIWMFLENPETRAVPLHQIPKSSRGKQEMKSSYPGSFRQIPPDLDQWGEVLGTVAQ